MARIITILLLLLPISGYAQDCDFFSYFLDVQGFNDCTSGEGTLCIATTADVVDLDCVNGYRLEVVYTTGDFIYTNLNNPFGWDVISEEFPGQTILGTEPFVAFDILSAVCLDGIIQEPGTVFTIRLVAEDDPTDIVFSDEYVLDDITEIGSPGTDILLSDLIDAGLLLPANEAASSGQRICVAGNLIVDENYTFSSSPVSGNGFQNEISMKADASIIIEEGITLTLNYARVTGCDARWNRILVQDGSSLRLSVGGFLSDAIIEDATTAVELLDGGSLRVNNASFFDNEVAIGSFGPDYKEIELETMSGFAPSIFIRGGTDGIVMENTNLIDLPGAGYIRDLTGNGISVENTDLMIRRFTIEDTRYAISSTGDSELLDIRDVTLHDNSFGVAVLGNPSIFNFIESTTYNNFAGVGINGCLNCDARIENIYSYGEFINFGGVLQPSRGELLNNSFVASYANNYLWGAGDGNQNWLIGFNYYILDENYGMANIVLDNVNFPRVFRNPYITSFSRNVMVRGGSRAILGYNDFMEVFGSSSKESIEVENTPLSRIYCNKIESGGEGIRLLQDNTGLDLRGNELISSGDNIVLGNQSNTFSIIGTQIRRGNLFDPSSPMNPKVTDFNSDNEIADLNRFIVGATSQGSSLFPYFESINSDLFESVGGGNFECASGIQPPDGPTEVELEIAIEQGLAAIEKLNFSGDQQLSQNLSLHTTRNLSKAGWPTMTGSASESYLAESMYTSDFRKMADYESSLVAVTTYAGGQENAAAQNKESINGLLARNQELLSSKFNEEGEYYDLSEGDLSDLESYRAGIKELAHQLNQYNNDFKENLQANLPILKEQVEELTSSNTENLELLAKMNAVYLQILEGGNESVETRDAYAVKEVANLCAGLYGDGVYLARSLVLMLEGLPTSIVEYNDDCVAGGKKFQEQIAKSGTVAEKMTLHPNPGVDFVTLSLPEIDLKETSRTIEVFDALGRKVDVSIVQNGDHQFKLDVRELPAGSYFVKVENGENGTETMPFFKR